jgi:hypothetical protein
MPITQVHRLFGEIHPRHRPRVQVAAHEEGAATSSRAHLQDIPVSQISVVDRMQIQLDAQPIPFIRRPQRRPADIYRRGSIAIVHERPIRRQHTFRQGLITGSPHQSPDGHRPRYRPAEPTLGEPTSATPRVNSPKASSRLITERRKRTGLRAPAGRNAERDSVADPARTSHSGWRMPRG